MRRLAATQAAASAPLARHLSAVAGLAVLLAACGFTEAGSRARDIAADEGAKAYDEGLANAEFFICRAASVGSVQRRYGRTAETAQAWRTICLGDGGAAVEVIRAPMPSDSAAGPGPELGPEPAP